MVMNSDILDKLKRQMRLRGQAVKTSPFHGGNTGSIPVGVTFGKRSFLITASKNHFRIQGSLAQLVRATGS